MPSTSHNQALGSTDNRADYQRAFLTRVHELLQLGFESLRASDYKNAEEDDITGDICKHLKHLTEVAPTKTWMRHFSVHDQDPSNDVPSKKPGQTRKGKRRPKIDLRLVSKLSLPNQGYWLEAKRLYRSDSVSEYAGDAGVGAFVCGEYAKDDAHGGMAGYIQTESVSTWLPKIAAKLSDSKTGTGWKATKFKGGPEICFVSQHQRDDGREITLYHIMFNFTT